MQNIQFNNVNNKENTAAFNTQYCIIKKRIYHKIKRFILTLETIGYYSLKYHNIHWGRNWMQLDIFFFPHAIRKQCCWLSYIYTRLRNGMRWSLIEAVDIKRAHRLWHPSGLCVLLRRPPQLYHIVWSIPGESTPPFTH